MSSAFVAIVDAMCARYNVSARDRRRVLVRYPLFKLAWLAQYAGSPRVRALARRAMQPFARTQFTYEVTGPSGRRIAVPLRFDEFDLASYREVFFGGEYEADVDLSGALVYVDLGANTGMAALHFLARAPLEKVLLIEANAELIPRLTETVRPRGIDVAVENVAVGAGDAQTVRFTVADNHRHSNARAPGSLPGREVEVRAVRLRALMEQHGIARADIVKMDIEGSEHALLAEDPDLFTTFGVLFAEVHGDQEQRDHFIERLQSLGFSIHSHNPFPELGCESVVATR